MVDIKALIDNPLLSLVGNFVPQARSVIDFVRAHEDIILKGAPVVQAAIAEGLPAFEAARAKAPEFAAAVKNLITLLPHGSIAGTQPDMHLENITRNLVGSHRMSAAEETAWMDRASPLGQNDSGQGSG